MRKFNNSSSQNTSLQTSFNINSSLSMASEPPSAAPLEKVILLHYLYPKYFLELMLSERVIQYTKTNVQGLLDKTIPKTEKARGASLLFSETLDKIDFCPFLVGYNKEVASAFRNTFRVKKILKNTNSHIISLKKYLKHKEQFIEEYRAFYDVKESHTFPENTQYLLVTRYDSFEEMETNPQEEIKERLLGARTREAGNEDPEFVLKTTRVFELNKIFEEEPIEIKAEMFKDMMKKYEKLVAITPKIETDDGKYYVSFILTSFSGADLFGRVMDELEEYFNYMKELQLNHFELSYWKKRLYPSLKELEASLNLDVKLTEYHLSKDNWSKIFGKSFFAGKLEITGQKNNVLKYFDKVKSTFDQLYQYRVEVPIKLSERLFHDFKTWIFNWISLIDAKLPEITFTNQAFQTEDQEEKKEPEGNYLIPFQPQNNQKSAAVALKNFIVLYAIGPMSQRREVEVAGNRAARALSNLQSHVSKTRIEDLRKIARETGFSDFDELQNCFGIIIREKEQDPDNQNLPKIYGRKEDIFLFTKFLKENYKIFDSKKLIYQMILQIEGEADNAAQQCYVEIKIHYFLPKILILGSPVNINNFVKNFLEKKIQAFEERTKDYPAQIEIIKWLQKYSNNDILNHLQRKHDVYVDFPAEQNPENPKLTLIGDETDCKAFLKEATNLILGKPITREINIEGAKNNTDPHVLLKQAEKTGLKAQFKEKPNNKGKDKTIIIVEGLYEKVREFQQSLMKKENKDPRLRYPKFWSHDQNGPLFRLVQLPEHFEEYKNMLGIFSQTMKDFIVNKIQRIQNECLIVNFLKLHQNIEAKGSSSKMYCFYASGDFDPAQIYKDYHIGFDLQFSNDKDKKGFWFSLDAINAHESHAFQTENRVFKMLIVDLIVDNSWKTKPNMNQKEFLIESGYHCYPMYLIDYISKK